MTNKLGIIIGNGGYATEIMTRLGGGEQTIVVSILPEHLSMFHEGIELHASPAEFGSIINCLRANDVQDVVFAGDVGLYKIPDFLNDLFIKNAIFSGVNYEYLLRNIFKLGVASILQFAHGKLIDNSITPRIASELLPDLKPDCGVILQGGAQLSELELLNHALATLNVVSSQPRRRVRQVAAFDGRSLVGVERESTDTLLEDVRGIPKPNGTVRTIVKICPPSVVPTMDAPVIGPDTIQHCIEAQVDVIILDCKSGILAGRQEAIKLARESGITIYGVDPAVVLRA